MNIELIRINTSDGLDQVTKDLNTAGWDDTNDIKGYDERYVREFVESPDNVLLVAYVENQVAGVALASKNYAPYGPDLSESPASSGSPDERSSDFSALDVATVTPPSDKITRSSPLDKTEKPVVSPKSAQNNTSWLYIDEVDVSPKFRRQGIGKALMKKLFEIGKQMGLKEAWVGTEPDNDGANHLYKSLKPSEIEDFIGYTYKIN